VRPSQNSPPGKWTLRRRRMSTTSSPLEINVVKGAVVAWAFSAAFSGGADEAAAVGETHAGSMGGVEEKCSRCGGDGCSSEWAFG